MLLLARPVVDTMRANGAPWLAIANDRRANPLRLSDRQMARVYSPKGKKGLDAVITAAKKVG